MEKINRTGQLRAVKGDDENSKSYEFVISTEAVDRHGTVMMASGWDLTQYRNNPVVFYQHSGHGSDPDTVIGTSEVRQEGDSLVATLKLESEEINPLAAKIARKIEAGTLRAASIGAIPSEGHWGDFDRGENPEVLYFTKQELLEWSVVAVPSNREALKRDFTTDFPKPKKPENKVTGRAIDLFEAQLLINKNK